MPVFNLFKNCAYYWGFAAFVSYFVNHPLYTAPPALQTHVALALAGCSFEAYDECEGDSLVEQSPSGSTIRYVDE